MLNLGKMFAIFSVTFFGAVFALKAQQPAPPNGPATVMIENGLLNIDYNKRLLLNATIDPQQFHFEKIESWTGTKLNQVFVIESKNGKDFDITGEIYGSAEAFACEADYPSKTIPIVRHSYGQSNNLLNRAVYDRASDWVISFDLPNNVQIQYADGHLPKYKFSAHCSKLSIRFRPRFYQQHKGLQYFEPWNYNVWRKPVVGWCSWFAYMNTVTEENIHATADSLSHTLLPYGYKYLQIDDGYQQEPIGKPEHWLQPNKKFPHGLDGLSAYIKSKGLEPGIWTNVSCADSSFAFSHPEWFVKNQEHKPALGEWVGYVMDGANPATIDKLFSPVYSTLRKQGWNYFKVDALRHLKYEGYNTFQDYFNKKHINRDSVFRSIVQHIRTAIGKDTYLLGCWGIRPELIGIIDGCRIGDDGFSYAGLAQYNSFNNVVWRNDPDHVELTDAEAFRSCSVTSLTGSVLLLTDKPERYKGRILEAARRTAPVLFTQPGQVYEVDPSRIQSLNRVESEISGSGPRPFDAGYTALTELYALEINRPYENWLLLGRMNEKNKQIDLPALGLKRNTVYEVFEFWTKTWLGTCSNKFVFPAIDSNYNCQVFCFREQQDHPQLLATNRHITCGGLELQHCEWKDNVLSGVSDLVANDAYTIYISVPEGFSSPDIDSDAAVIATTNLEHLLTVTLKKASAGTAKWRIHFKK
jgi:hypothetical protein